MRKSKLDKQIDSAEKGETFHITCEGVFGGKLKGVFGGFIKGKAQFVVQGGFGGVAEATDTITYECQEPYSFSGGFRSLNLPRQKPKVHKRGETGYRPRYDLLKFSGVWSEP